MIEGSPLKNYSPEELFSLRQVFVNAIIEIIAKTWDKINTDLDIGPIDNPYAAYLCEEEDMGGVIRAKNILNMERELEYYRSLRDGSCKDDGDISSLSSEAQGYVRNYCKFAKIVDPGDTILTFNYDHFLEFALSGVLDRKDIDYGVNYRELSPDVDLACHGPICYRIRTPDWVKYKLHVFWLHGSINWGRCTNCGELFVTYLTPWIGVQKYIEYIKSLPPKEQERYFCCEKFDPKSLIVPPFGKKVERSPYLIEISNAAIEKIAEADELYFLGYSLAPSDTKIRDIIHEAKIHRHGKRWNKVVVVHTRIPDVTKNYEEVFGDFIPFNGKVAEYLDSIPDSDKPFHDPPKQIVL
ncbi:hypothetical protein [uncultured Methanospirillum sp.]|uniref:hypothetical protein n=1 Tax=uncultured Methanospirillum sp. TaxID=262503 RepID=UPI0029C96B44|nr:hypothetical protein [uncultured Methanospirillum sp.]